MKKSKVNRAHLKALALTRDIVEFFEKEIGDPYYFQTDDKKRQKQFIVRQIEKYYPQ